MFSPLQSSLRFLRYYFTARNSKGHGTHSPFIFEFITHVLNDKEQYPEYEKVEALRKKMLADTTILSIDEMGAGSAVSKTNNRPIASIARNSAKSKKFGQLLFRMVRCYKPCTIIELGTSLGITTAYLSMGKPAAQVITMEGANAVAEKAEQNFKGLGLNNITIVRGNFDNTLQKIIDRPEKIDFVFIDGNHRQEPTERYFQQLLPKVQNDTILIFDDIHWSDEMEKAWKTIKEHPDVRCSIDLFFIGIVFFRREFHEKQHFTIRF